LSDNQVRSLSIDKSGFLWVGTVDGLNVYDGYSVTSFRKDEYPLMASNSIMHLLCDKQNKVWMCTPDGINWLDENRKFHRVIINDSVEKFGSRTVLETRSYGIVLYTSIGQFYHDSTTGKWTKIEWIPESLKFTSFLDAEAFDEDRIIYSTFREVLIVDYKTRKIIFQQPYTQHAVSVCRISADEIAIGMLNGTVDVINIKTKKLIRQYKLTNEVNGKSINTSLTEVRPASNGDILVATGFAGLIIIGKDGKVTRYTHDPIDRRTVAANNTYRVLGGRRGEVIVGTNSSGISITNIYNRKAGYTGIFKDQAGNFFDNYLTDIEEGSDEHFWIGAYDRLIHWNRKTNVSRFYNYYFQRPGLLQSLEIRSLCIDKSGRPWVSPFGDGIAILNEKTGTFEKVARDTTQGSAPRYGLINDLLASSDGYIWVGNPGGVFKIHATTKKVTGFVDHPTLKEVLGKNVISLYEDRQQRIWIGTQNAGLFVYDMKTETVKHYGKTEGMLSNTCYSTLQDQRGNFFLATPEGFNILYPDGKIDSYNQESGLLYDKCEGFLEDELGYIWIANTKSLVRFDPVKKSMKYFDQHAGLSEAGFNPGGFTKAKNGELIWGTRNGINYFFSDQLRDNTTQQLQVNIYQASIRDSVIRTGTDYTLKLPYSENDVMFHFSAINLVGSRNIRYQYMLEGYDKNWVEGTDVRQVRYASLPPGKYQFKVKASTDRRNWVASRNTFQVEVIPPAWQQWWFIGAGVALLTGVIFWILASRNQKIKEQREEIETEQAISYFASSMSEQQTEEDIVWDVVKNCISRLKFEDCVIYLMNEQDGMLVQKAAHGPKSPRDFELMKPIGISPGMGIVGSVALSGKAEIISDTTKDSRYIVDDAQRYSEITVPITYNGQVIGVIDCEHSKKGFFTQKHLSILSTIASLCANKIVRSRAEKEKNEAQNKLMSTQQKMTEVEMQALRAQMNPHFIFNCLNSINRYIVKSDQTTASFYLTKFAKLIRLILDNSNSKNVILTNELEALKLYIEMEALRFDKKFTYNIQVEKNLGTDCVEVPPLIIQPYVENAIWHGLLHKETNGHLSINVTMAEDSMLQCVIEDNGIGRAKAKELKSKTATSRKSLGMQLTENRLSLLNKHAELNASVEIIDMQDEDGAALGTKVVLKIPV
jgi:ligand-binding sensor domain-containing protein/putative methionine-R-sulfoxide reductase with GAF domain